MKAGHRLSSVALAGRSREVRVRTRSGSALLKCLKFGSAAVSKSRSERQKEEQFLALRLRRLQSKEGVILYAALPQTLALPVAEQVEPGDRFVPLGVILSPQLNVKILGLKR